MIEFGGPMATHMALHILSMNVAAPIAALVLANIAPDRFSFLFRGSLLPASLAQVGTLWGWHAPGILPWALNAPVTHILMQFSLLAVAFWFWGAVFATAGASRWRALFALLATGKLVCLLGVLLVFAPRVLYSGMTNGHGTHGSLGDGGLPDQQLSGLLMLMACPLTYVLAGIIIAARWLRELETETRPFPAAPPVRIAAE